MDDSFINDPQLRSLEERLANMMLRLPPRESQRILYQCAFEAGQKMARRRVWRWQTVAAALAVMLMSVSVLLFREDRSVAQQTVAPTVAKKVPTRPLPETTDLRPLSRPGAEVKLDAWQVERSPSESLAHELARFAQTDPNLRSYAVGALTRSVLEP